MISLALGALFLAFSMISTGLAMADKPPAATYLALGDSLAVGVGATPLDGRFGYVGRFNHYFQDSRDGPHGLSNIAVSGETSSSFIRGGQLAAAVDAITDDATDIQVVTLDIGGNDLLALVAPGTPCSANTRTLECQLTVARTLGTFAANYHAILTDLGSAVAVDPATVFVMTYYNPFNGTGDPREAVVDATLVGADGRIDCSAIANPSSVGLNDLIVCIGAGSGVRIVDTYPLFEGNAAVLTHIGGGDIHPNSDGYAAIADAFVVAAQ